MTNALNIDITSLSTEQLDLLEKIAPEQVAAEKARRTSFNTMEEALTVVFQASADLAARFGAMKLSPAAKEFKASGIFEALTRFQNFAKLNELPFTEPSIPTYAKPVMKRTKKGETETPAEGTENAPEATNAPEGTENAPEATDAPEGTEAASDETSSGRGRRGK